MLLGPERGCPLSLGKRRRPLERGQLLPRTLQLRLGHAHHRGVLDRSLERGDAWVVKGGGISRDPSDPTSLSLGASSRPEPPAAPSRVAGAEELSSGTAKPGV